MTLRACISIPLSVGATVAVAMPVAQVDYILLTAVAILDNSGKYPRIVDAVAVVDSAKIGTFKGLFESFGANDKSSVFAQKPLKDTIGFVDAFARRLTYVRYFADVASISEVKKLSVTKQLTDSTALTDVSSKVFLKTLKDAFGTNDSVGAVDGSKRVFSKNINNVAIASDLVKAVVVKSFIDAVSSPDSGTVSTQNYCNSAYFATDYVGSVCTF